MSDAKLIAKQAETRRAVSSSVSGVIISTGLAVACPIFAISAGINLWQMGANSISRYRVKREVSKRKANDGEFRRVLEKRDHPVRDIALGCTLRAALSAVSVGIIGFGHVAANFCQLAHQGASVAGHSLASERLVDVAGSHTPGITSEANLHPGKGGEGVLKQHFEAKHPRLGHADDNLHKATGWFGNKAEDGAASVTNWKIDSNTRWSNLHEMQTHGAKSTVLAAQVGIVGAFSELAQPLLQAVDITQSEIRSWWKARRVRLWILQSCELGGKAHLKPEEQQVLARKQVAGNEEMEQVLRKRRIGGQSTSSR